MEKKNGNASAYGDSNHTTLAQAMEEVDIFLKSNSYPSNPPTAVQLLLTTVENMITAQEINASFLDAVDRVSRLSNTKATVVLRKAMPFLEEEFRSLLTKCDDYTTLPPAAVTSRLAAIAAAMNAAGYSAECRVAYTAARRSALDSALEKLGYQKIVNPGEIRKETLKPSVAAWVSVAEACSSVLFPGERSLRAAVFSDGAGPGPGPGDLSRVAADLLGFARAVAERPVFFSLLEMFESLGDVSEAEMLAVKAGVREMAAAAFFSITTVIVEPHKRVPPRGPGPAVQVVTRGVMKYLALTCARRDTLERVFAGDAFGGRVEAIMDILEETLEAQSEFHEDRSLKYVFMMNNTRFLDQKARESEEIRQLAGDAWRARRTARMRRYHQEYLRESWGKVVECLEGRLEVSRQVLRPVLTWRLKSFNAMFEAIHRAQKRWELVDEWLRARLRVSIWAAVVPPYRAFLKQFLDLGRHRDDKLVIKYGPVDIETMIDELFYGK